MRVLVGPGNLSALPPKVFVILQSCAINEPLFPNLGSLELWDTVGEFVPFIPSFLSPTTTAIDIKFMEHADLPNTAFASMVTAFPTLCPSLQKISLRCLPRDPTIVAAVSQFLLTTNRGALQLFHVDSPLTEEAHFPTRWSHFQTSPTCMSNTTETMAGCKGFAERRLDG
jgi:hypothetical protein